TLITCSKYFFNSSSSNSNDVLVVTYATAVTSCGDNHNKRKNYSWSVTSTPWAIMSLISRQ
ncbi:MAG: hypothetical protein WBZ50_10195, partial [Nitrososphaeraceae archaeon]